MPSYRKRLGLSILAGALLAFATPPWGWWPLAFIGIALLDVVVHQATTKQRATFLWVGTSVWFFIANLWLWDFSPPGYIFAGLLIGAFFAVAGALCPPNAWRYILFPGLFVLVELVRWNFPFGGLPISNLSLTQAMSPIGQLAKFGGPTLVVIIVAFVGQSLGRSIRKRKVGPILLTTLLLLPLLGLAALYEPGRQTSEIEVALVQGGGQQRTRAGSEPTSVVLQRHLDVTNQIVGNPDLILWPENVVNPNGQEQFDEFAELLSDEVLANYDSDLSAGWFLPISDTNTANYQQISTPDNFEVDRYDKVIIVPFGEFVPFRAVVEQFSSEIPSRDVQRGTEAPVLETSFGTIGSAISWEGFFDERARSAVRNGAELLTNPTNGSSFWLTQVQTQQIAANQLHAISYGRWNLQVGPTGLSAVIDNEGSVIERSDVSEARLISQTVELRQGSTLASIFGIWPALIYGILSAVFGLKKVRTRALGHAVSGR